MSADPRYPIGPFTHAGPLDEAARAAAIEAIENLPLELRKAVRGLSDAQLATPYRDGGWTLRQLVNHVADSHVNAYCRFRLALTEDNPTIRPYEEQLWANLADGAGGPIGISLALLDALHARLGLLLRSLAPADFDRTFVHPASGPHDLHWLLACYAWHGAHHTAHVTALRAARGW